MPIGKLIGFLPYKLLDPSRLNQRREDGTLIPPPPGGHQHLLGQKLMVKISQVGGVGGWVGGIGAMQMGGQPVSRRRAVGCGWWGMAVDAVLREHLHPSLLASRRLCLPAPIPRRRSAVRWLCPSGA